jgi:hypothetical protein
MISRLHRADIILPADGPSSQIDPEGATRIPRRKTAIAVAISARVTPAFR